MRRLACLPCFFLALALGCTPQNAPPPTTAKVTGKVTLDDKAMPVGEVRFTVMGQPPKICTVKDGAFSGEAFIGKNRVDIVLEKDGPPSTTDPKTPTRINTVTHKNLEAEVKEGPNTFTFEATSLAK